MDYLIYFIVTYRNKNILILGCGQSMQVYQSVRLVEVMARSDITFKDRANLTNGKCDPTLPYATRTQFTYLLEKSHNY